MGSSVSAGGEWEPPSVSEMGAMLPGYAFHRLLGHGGMGAVYEAVQTNLDRRVAIKVLPESLGADEGEMKFAERFELEAKSMAKLDHPGIISVYDFGKTSSGHLYFAMEFIDGMDIHQYLQTHGGKLPPDQAIAITAHVLDALGYSHQNGIVHRDIKPANIMIKSDGRVKLADFGLVKRLSGSGESPADSLNLTRTNLAFGTPDYVAPETLEAGRPVDHRADLYAVGVMLYNLLTGSVPRGNFRPPSGRIGGLDPRIDGIVARAMEANPDQRFQNAAEFRGAIDQMLTTPIPLASAGGPPPAAPAATPAAAAAAPRTAAPVGEGKGKGMLFAGLGVVTVALVVGIIATSGGKGDGDKAADNDPEVPAPEPEPPHTVRIDDFPTIPPGSGRPPRPRPDGPGDRPSPPPREPVGQGVGFEPVDLLKHVDLELTPEHWMEGGALHSKANIPIVIDYDLVSLAKGGGYVIEAVITPQMANGFHWGLPLRGRRAMLIIDQGNKTGNRHSEVGFKHGRPVNPTRIDYVGTIKLPQRKESRLRVAVSDERIRAEVNGEKLVGWDKSLGDLPQEWGPAVKEVRQHRKLVLSFFGPYVVHQLQLLPPGGTEVAATGDPPKPPAPEPAPPTPPSPEPAPEPAPPAADDPIGLRLADLEAKFKETYEKPYNDALATLKAQFLTALEREADAATGGGDLDVVLAFQNEAKKIEAGEAAGSITEEGAPARLIALRKTWHDQETKFATQRDATRGESLVALNRALDAYQAELVKAKDIAGAQRIREWRAELAGAPAPAPLVPTAPEPRPEPSPRPIEAGRPVITKPPVRKEARERAARAGQLVAFNLADPKEPRVLAEDVVDFCVGGGGMVFALRSSGEMIMPRGASGWPAAVGFAKHEAELKDVASLNVQGGNNVAALRSDGSLVAYGDEGFERHWRNARDSQPRDAVEIVDGDYLAALRDNGRIHPLQGGSYKGFLSEQRQVVDVVFGIGSSKVPLVLSERGSLEMPDNSLLDEKVVREITRTRNAVRVAAHHEFMALLDTGELKVWGEEGVAVKLPADLPRDIEVIQAGNHGRNVGEHLGVLVAKSRSQGWLFFGEKTDAARLAAAAEGCFAIKVRSGVVVGLRDTVPAAE